jgi:hypothetical protein
MKNANASSGASTQISSVVGENDLKDILTASVSLVEPTQEKTQRLFLTVWGTSHHDGSVSRLAFEGRVDEKGVSYHRISLASVYVGGAIKESPFAVSLLLPVESEKDKNEVTEVRVQGTVMVTTPPTVTSRTVVKPVPLPHPR